MKKAQLIQPLLAVILIAMACQLAPAQSDNSTSAGSTHQNSPVGRREHCKGHPHDMKQRMARELGLSAAQQEKLDAIHHEFRESHKPDFEKMKADFQQLNAQVKTVLTPEQAKKMDTLGMGPPPEFKDGKGDDKYDDKGGCFPPPPRPGDCGP